MMRAYFFFALFFSSPRTFAFASMSDSMFSFATSYRENSTRSSIRRPARVVTPGTLGGISLSLAPFAIFSISLRTSWLS